MTVAFVPMSQGTCEGQGGITCSLSTAYSTVWLFWEDRQTGTGTVFVLGKPCAHLFWDGFKVLMAEMQQNAGSRCPQLLILIVQNQEHKDPTPGEELDSLHPLPAGPPLVRARGKFVREKEQRRSKSALQCFP